MPSERSWTVADLPKGLVRALDLAVETRARLPVILRIAETGGYTDWAMLLSGRSERNVKAITESILGGLAREGISPLGTDGVNEGQWALLDLDEFVVHVFYHPVRAHYDLESMWSDAPRVALDLPADVMDDHDLIGLDVPEPMPGFRAGFLPASRRTADSGAATQDEFGEFDIGEFGGFEDEFDELGVETADQRAASANRPAATPARRPEQQQDDALDRSASPGSPDKADNDLFDD